MLASTLFNEALAIHVAIAQDNVAYYKGYSSAWTHWHNAFQTLMLVSCHTITQDENAF